LLAQLVDLGVDPWDVLHEHVNDSPFPGIPSGKHALAAREQEQHQDERSNRQRDPGDDLEDRGHSYPSSASRSSSSPK
jgi:hypothetical protein